MWQEAGGETVEVRWVPGHCKIPGNEVADKEAKVAVAGDVPVGPAYTSIAFVQRVITERKWKDADTWIAKRRMDRGAAYCPSKKR